MKRMITGVLAAGAAAMLLFSTSAQAHERDGRDEDHREYRDEGRHDGRYQRAHEWRDRRWRELQRVRHAFYARWDGNPWRRARFERWYQQRCAELHLR